MSVCLYVQTLQFPNFLTDYGSCGLFETEEFPNDLKRPTELEYERVSMGHSISYQENFLFHYQILLQSYKICSAYRKISKYEKKRLQRNLTFIMDQIKLIPEIFTQRGNDRWYQYSLFFYIFLRQTKLYFVFSLFLQTRFS